MSATIYKKLRNILMLLVVICLGTWQAYQLEAESAGVVTISQIPVNQSAAATALSELPIKGRAPKAGYTRAQFSSGWGDAGSCDVRNYILTRDLRDVQFVPYTCQVASGKLQDPYTTQIIQFVRGPSTSDDIQIDHVVALSDAWQKGAQQLTSLDRYLFANDPLNLLAVQGDANQQKGDGDAATWLPPNKSYRCSYVARQIAVKQKYRLWVTTAEYMSIERVLSECPEQRLPT